MTTNSELTPAMRQYLQIKNGLPEKTILLFRMGDFYELFFEDARTAAPLMDIVLTARSGVPMCGVPHHSMRGYIGKILDGGFNVAVAEQMEDPKLAKGLVKRDVTQIITPGTVLDDDMLAADQNHYLVALHPQRQVCGLAMLDFTTGDFRLTEVDSVAALEAEVHRLHPAECLLPASCLERWKQEGFPDFPSHVAWTPLDDWHFDHEMANDILCRHFGVASLDGFGCRGLGAAVAAAGAMLGHVKNILRRDSAHLTSLSSYQTEEGMILDRISQRNLELVEPIFSDGKGNTLLSILDHTVTPMGARLLREWILRPMRDIKAIEQRLDAVDDLLKTPMLLLELRELLTAVRDLERVVARLNLGTANARDLQVLKLGMEGVPGLRAVLQAASTTLLRQLRDDLTELPEAIAWINRAIVDEPPLAIKEGGIIRAGYHEELDLLRRAFTEGKDWIAGYQVKEQERTGIKSLKVRYNKIFGYFIEITKTNLEMIPDDYMRKQTLVNAERFITPELKEIEDKVIGSEEKSKALEYELFQELRQQLCQHTVAIQRNAQAVARLDCLASLAEVASRQQYIRPRIVSEPVLDIRGGRHPVLEARLQNETFVPNDVHLDARLDQLAIITGPNMAGKSTYIRQVALLTLMAQLGSFIPADQATIGIVDRIFTRVGAADDISRGQSTFMVEMVETANILNHATPASLIILDEIGRGTSTFDGLSLAWAVAEFLHDQPNVKARTLFATHYHELTDLALTKNGVRNYNVLVQEQGEKISFMRKIVPGSADKSYGIHVARLAGLPKEVISRATEVLKNLESNEFEEEGKPKIARTKRKKGKDAPEQPMLFDF